MKSISIKNSGAQGAKVKRLVRLINVRLYFFAKLFNPANQNKEEDLKTWQFTLNFKGQDPNANNPRTHLADRIPQTHERKHARFGL